MPNKVFNDLTELAEGPAIADLFAISDISDTTDAPFGTSKKNKAQYALGSQVNAQTGTSYTYLTTDFRKLVTHSNGSAIAGTLPQAGASFPAGWFMFVQNRGAGALTITPTTSTIDGAATLALNQNEGAVVISDGANYFTLRGKATGAAGVGDVVGPASATDNALARFDTTTGKLIQNSAVTVDDNGAVTVPEIAAPATPASGKVVIYVKSDGKLYIKDDTGAETDLTAAGSPSFPLLAPDGSLAAPSYAFTNGADCGVFLVNGTPDHLKVSVGNKEHLDIYQGTGNKPVVLLNLNNDNRLGWGNGLLRSGLADGGKGSVRFISDESGTSGCGFSATADLVDVAGTRRPYHVAGQVFRHVLTGNRTIGPVSADGGSNSISGIIITIILVQDATGSRTVSWDSSYKWAGGSAPTMTSAANAVDIYRFWCDGSNQAFELSRAMDVK